MAQQTDNIYTWDLESLLDNDSLSSLYDKVINQQNKLIELYQNFLDSEDNFINFLFENELLIKLSNRLNNYLSNHYQEELSNPQWIGWLQKLSNQSIEFNKVFSDYDNVILANKAKVMQYLQNPKISEYQRSFNLIFRYEPHVLSKDNELLLSQISIYNGGVDDIYSSLTDSDLTFNDAKDSKGNIVKITTQADVFKNLRSQDEELRKTSWYSFHQAFYQFRNTLTKCLYYNYLTLNTNAKLRHFADYIDSTAFSDEINKDFIFNLYQEIKTYQPLVQKYQNARKKYLKQLLNKSTLMPWDMSVELNKIEKTYSLEEVKMIAKDALSILGTEYQNLVQKAYDEKWISFLPSPNKQTGAYSIGGTKGLSKYFISMNYDSTIQSIYTLVHELGHSMNSYFYGQHQNIYQDTTIFYAEIASITNEMILSHYLLNKYQDNLEMKLVILDQMISGFFNTTSRQIVFSNFEWIANEWVNNGQEFTYEKVTETYYELVKEYLGVEHSYDEYQNDPYKYSLITPLRISHFFVGNFYVYKYCIGQIAAIIASDRIIRKHPYAIENLFKFLSSGNSLSPLETIQLLGIDLNDPQVYIEAKKILNSWIDEFSVLVDKLIEH